MTVSELHATGSASGLEPSVPGAVDFTLLGQLEVRKDGVDLAPTAPKVRQLLGLLLLSPGRVVHIDTVVEELWAGRPPRSCRTTMQTYVYHLRRCIEANGLAADAEEMLETRHPGYVLRIAPDQVDLHHFRRRCEQGRALTAAGRPADAARVLRSALDLWSGPPLANVACGPVLSSHVVGLQEQHRNALHLRIEAEIACGAHRELVGELRSRTTVDGLDEVLHGQLMRALARSGRRSDAMTVYRDLRARLDRELGVEPGEELRTRYVELLDAA